MGQQRYRWSRIAPLCLGLMLSAWACSDADEMADVQPDEMVDDDVHVDDYTNNNIHVGKVAPCDVVSSPGALIDAGISFGDVPLPVYLPSIRVGFPGAYSAQIPGVTASELRSGALPPGLSLTNGVVSGEIAAAAVSGDQAVLYTFEVEGTDNAQRLVRLTVYPESWAPAADVPEYWKRGPYKTWNTEPLESCPQNPIMPEFQDDADIELFMTYPAEVEPTVEGRGDVAPGRWPVIIFAHANNDWACDINEGYRSLHDHWASWGYIVVAVDMTELNCQLGYPENFEDRTQRQLAAIDTLAALDQDTSSRFYGRIDLARVVMAGHSRGGFSSIRALYYEEKIQAAISLQGVSIMAFGIGVDAVPAIPVMGITAQFDVDLTFPEVETTEDRLTGPYAWVDIGGGAHALTADTAPLDPGEEPKITKQRQHDITELFTTAFLARYIGVGDGSAPYAFVPDMRAEAVVFDLYGATQAQTELSDLGARVRWSRHRSEMMIDDFNSSFEGDMVDVNDLGGDNEASGLTWEEVPTYDPDNDNPDIFFLRSISLRLMAEAEGEFRMFLSADRTPRSVGSGSVLMARVRGPDAGEVAGFDLEVETTEGKVRVDGSAYMGPVSVPLVNRFTQLVVPIDSLNIGSEVISVALHVEGGTLFVDDVRIE